MCVDMCIDTRTAIPRACATAPSERSDRGGHLEHRHVDARAMNIPFANRVSLLLTRATDAALDDESEAESEDIDNPMMTRLLFGDSQAIPPPGP